MVKSWSSCWSLFLSILGIVLGIVGLIRCIGTDRTKLYYILALVGGILELFYWYSDRKRELSETQKQELKKQDTLEQENQ